MPNNVGALQEEAASSGNNECGFLHSRITTAFVVLVSSYSGRMKRMVWTKTTGYNLNLVISQSVLHLSLLSSLLRHWWAVEQTSGRIGGEGCSKYLPAL